MSHDGSHARLLGAALDGAHPDYFEGIPRDLLTRGRGSPVGRRILLRKLLSRGHPLLVGLFALKDEVIAGHAWVLWDARKLHDAAADLGAIALVPGLRACIERSRVLRLRTAIGSRRLSMALTFDSGMPVPEAVNSMARKALAEVIDDVDAIAALVARSGYRELAGYAARIHPAFGERVRLAFRPDWRDDPAGTWLAMDAVTHYFDIQLQQDQRASDDAAQPCAEGAAA